LKIVVLALMVEILTSPGFFKGKLKHGLVQNMSSLITLRNLLVYQLYSVISKLLQISSTSYTSIRTSGVFAWHIFVCVGHTHILCILLLFLYWICIQRGNVQVINWNYMYKQVFSVGDYRSDLGHYEH